MPRRVSVTAPSRLHLGLYALATGQPRRFGGIGLMIAEPSWRLEWEAAEKFAVVGLEAERAAATAKQWQDFQQLEVLPACRVTIVRAPAPHVGLGSGTQLALSLAAGLCAWMNRDCGPPDLLARSVGRGRRSAVGTYGFVHGGLIAERGSLPDEFFPPLDARIALPEEWRFVLLRPLGEATVSGAEEESRLAALPASPEEVTAELITEARERLLPAAAAADFSAFSASIYAFNRRSGELFAASQGGPYNGPRVTELIELGRSLGVMGMGQSSWGPTVFAACPHPEAATQLAAAIRQQYRPESLDITITAPSNRGGTIECEE